MNDREFFQHTLLALFYRIDGGLELDNVTAHHGRVPGRVHVPADGAAEGALAGGLDVETRREGAVAGAGEDDGADVGVMAEAVEEGAELAPDGLREGVELLGAVDLDVDDEGGRRGDEEVFVGVVFERGGGHFCGRMRVGVRFDGGL